MSEQEKFYKVYPQYSGILERHEAGSIDWLNAMIPVRMFAVWQAAYASRQKEIDTVTDAAMNIHNNHVELNKGMQKKILEQQAKIDALMLEFCPDKMTV